MTLRGYFVLGASTEADLALSKHPIFYNPTAQGSVPMRSGSWGMVTDLPTTTVNIPTRNKRVQVWANSKAPPFLADLSALDSAAGINYGSKFLSMVDKAPGSLGFAHNDNKGQPSIVVFGGLTYFGLHDQKEKVSYLMWTDDLQDLVWVRAQDPLRYLLFRFAMPKVAFLQPNMICSKWRKWAAPNDLSNLLFAFNALEKRLTNVDGDPN